MDNSSDQHSFEGIQLESQFNKVKLFLLNIWNPTKAEKLTIEEFDHDHRRYIIQVQTIWKFKMLVITFNLFTCLIFTINFNRASFFLTSLLSITMPYIDKYTWLRFIVNGFLANEPKYFNYFFLAFALHIVIFIAWSAGLLWNSIGWYLLLIDPKNYGLLLSSLIIVNSMLLTVYLLMICSLFVQLIQHIRQIRPQFQEVDAEFQRLLHNVSNEVDECLEV